MYICIYVYVCICVYICMIGVVAGWWYEQPCRGYRTCVSHARFGCEEEAHSPALAPWSHARYCMCSIRMCSLFYFVLLCIHDDATRVCAMVPTRMYARCMMLPVTIYAPRIYVWHDPCVCVSWLTLMCVRIYAPRIYVWHDSCVCVSWLIHMCVTIYAPRIYVWHDSCVCVLWLTRMCVTIYAPRIYVELPCIIVATTFWIALW